MSRLRNVEIIDKRHIDIIEKEALVNIPIEEDIKVALKGAFREYLICTDKRLYIVKRGFMTGNTFGVGDFQMPYRNITNVQVVSKMITGYFEVSAGGMQNTAKSYWDNTGSNTDASKSPNSIALNDKVMKELFTKASRYIMDNIENKGEGKEITGKKEGNEGDTDKFEEIKKYKELLDLGIITEEEFDVKRKELI